jgi:hypothetical protein
MEGFELYKKVANLMLEVTDYYSKVAGYLRKSFKLYPTSVYDLESENKKLEATGLALYVHDYSIILCPLQYNEMLKSCIKMTRNP